MRVTTIRLPEDLAEQVDAVARVDGTSASQVIRTAIREYVQKRTAEREFRTRLAACIARDQALLAALAAEPTAAGADEAGGGS